MNKHNPNLQEKLHRKIESLEQSDNNVLRVINIAKRYILDLAELEGIDYNHVPNATSRICLILNDLDNPVLSISYRRVLSNPNIENLRRFADLGFDKDDFVYDINKDKLEVIVKETDSKLSLIELNYAVLIESDVTFKLNHDILKEGDYLVIHKPVFRNDILVDLSYYVLEPDFLIDVTQLATSVNKNKGMTNLFVFNMLNPFTPNENIYKGSLINSVLDILVTNKQRDFEAIFKKAGSGYEIEEELFKSHVTKMETEIKEIHYPKLVNIADRICKFNVLIEPTYISTDFGLKGRFDLLIDDDYNKSKHLIELKSGKPPDFGSWYAHRVQTTCYDLMLTQSIEEERTGKSYILYSKANINSILRENKINYSSVFDVNNLRNEIVALCREFCSVNPFKYIKTELFTSCPDFIKRDVEHVSKAYQQMSEEEKAYIGSVINYGFKELWNSKTGYYDNNLSDSGFNGLWRKSKEAKEAEFNILSDLKFIELEDNRIYFDLFDNQEHRFRENDSVMLYPNTGEGFNNHYIRAKYIGIYNNRLCLELHNKYPEALLDKLEYWNLEPDSFDSNYFRMFKSLTSFVLSCESKRKLLLGIIKPKHLNLKPDLSMIDNHLKEVIRDAFSCEDYYLLQGPPGTGKTSGFIMSYLKVALKETDEKFYLCAFTNQAVNEISSKLVNLKIPHIHIHGSSVRYIGTQDSSHYYRVIISTVYSFHGKGMMAMSLLKPKTLIIDEASQLLEQHLIGVLPHFQKFIMIGDENQLPAVTTLSEEQGKIFNTELNKLGLNSCKESIFSRLSRQVEINKWSKCSNILTKHYRMHNDIAGLINHYYDNKLMCASNRQTETSSYPRIRFIHVERSKTSYRNEKEAEITGSIVKEFSNLTCGVIVAFRAQISLIKNALPKETRDTITVDTVERFQGSEKDVIIFSPAVNSLEDLKRAQSLDSEGKVDRKLNVAISRARESFILLGDENILKQNQQYRDIIDKITMSNQER